MVGLGAPDDAAVWRLEDGQALVVSTDFFTPVVDDPYDYGAIAAANALSDVYAMGARPILALNVACLPPSLPLDMVQRISRGAAEKVREAGAVIAGGHSVQDDEPKVGLVALGLAPADRLMTKASARPGDILVLTKPLGTGVTTTALKAEQAERQHVEQAVAWMKVLNASVSRLAVQHHVKAATDVTGFSLLGHASEMAQASGVGVRFYASSIPVLTGARSYVARHHVPGGTYDNQLYFGPQVVFSQAVDEEARILLFDSQTSGGLLVAVPPDELAGFLEDAQEAKVPAWVIGSVESERGIRVVPESHPTAKDAAPSGGIPGSYELLIDSNQTP